MKFTFALPAPASGNVIADETDYCGIARGLLESDHFALPGCKDYNVRFGTHLPRRYRHAHTHRDEVTRYHNKYPTANSVYYFGERKPTKAASSEAWYADQDERMGCRVMAIDEAECLANECGYKGADNDFHYDAQSTVCYLSTYQ